MNATLLPYLLILVVLFVGGSIVIEIRRASLEKHTPLVERRKTRRIEKIDPLGEEVLDGAMDLVDENKLKTREGMRFIIRVMQEVYKSDVERTNKVNEIIEQFETLRNKSVTVFVEKYPKLSLFIGLLLFAWVTDEIRGPVVRALFALAHISLP